jgi:hypothetical protein
LGVSYGPLERCLALYEPPSTPSAARSQRADPLTSREGQRHAFKHSSMRELHMHRLQHFCGVASHRLPPSVMTPLSSVYVALGAGGGRGVWTDGGGDARGGDGGGIDGVTARVGSRGGRQGGHAGDSKRWIPMDISVDIPQTLTGLGCGRRWRRPLGLLMRGLVRDTAPEICLQR